jgi:protease I
VKSHKLTTKYRPVPDELRARLVGDAYEVPEFAALAPDSLKNYRVALVTTHGPELPEFDVPLTYLRDQGAVVDIVTQDWVFDYQPEAPGMVVLVQWLAVNVCAQADTRVSDARIEDYDMVIIIGGAWNPIMLRTDEQVLKFVRHAKERGLLIAAICHGPQVLISAGMYPPGTRATGVADIRGDMANAGFAVVDEAVVYDKDRRLITSRNPADLKEFCEQIRITLSETAPVASRSPDSAIV